jgi:hypothetical protein
VEGLLKYIQENRKGRPLEKARMVTCFIIILIIILAPFDDF